MFQISILVIIISINVLTYYKVKELWNDDK